jgi:hypothetical protein
MFMDELERIDRCTNSAAILEQHRLRAYYEFRDQSEPVERVAHSGPPDQRWPNPHWPVNTEVCSICGEAFPSWMQYRIHFKKHRTAPPASEPAKLVVPPSPPAPIPIAAATCQPAPEIAAASPQARLAPQPVLIAGCTVAQVLDAMARVANARARRFA